MSDLKALADYEAIIAAIEAKDTEIEALRERLAEVEAEREVQRASKEYAQRCCIAAEQANKRLRAETTEGCARVAAGFCSPMGDEVARRIRALASETAGGGGQTEPGEQT